MITVKNLKKIYVVGESPILAINGVSFKIQKGEFVAITGASGSGKSTLLHQLGLIDYPSEGDYYLNDVNLLRLSEPEKALLRLKHLGYIFQEYALVPELTALENVYLPLMAFGKSKSECVKIATNLMNEVGLGDKLFRLESQLSGGERQRIAVARALVNKPLVIFADEPCANLDTKNSVQVLELFKKLNRELKQTIIMVTHEDWHLKYVSRVIRLKDGVIVEDKKKNSSL